jgi:hypothetical protein
MAVDHEPEPGPVTERIEQLRREVVESMRAREWLAFVEAVQAERASPTDDTHGDR